MRTTKTVQMTQSMLIFSRLTFPPVHILKVKTNHIGFNIDLQRHPELPVPKRASSALQAHNEATKWPQKAL